MTRIQKKVLSEFKKRGFELVFQKETNEKYRYNLWRKDGDEFMPIDLPKVLQVECVVSFVETSIKTFSMCEKAKMLPRKEQKVI